jgi:anti-sigma regulatory factor (Ser/Thr protein kinase)
MQALEDTFAGVFPGAPEQISTARVRVRKFLDGCPAADNTVLILSELATNAAVHSLSRNGVFTVRVKRYDTCVYLEVEDAGGPWISTPRDNRPHGLDVVRTLARTWGIRESPGRRTVWATVDFQEAGGNLNSHKER